MSKDISKLLLETGLLPALHSTYAVSAIALNGLLEQSHTYFAEEIGKTTTPNLFSAM